MMVAGKSYSSQKMNHGASFPDVHAVILMYRSRIIITNQFPWQLTLKPYNDCTTDDLGYETLCAGTT
jgi:hypothetical protein